ncbi:MAG: glutaminyl-peptide cyclotransferase [Bacteroidota bacterium]
MKPLLKYILIILLSEITFIFNSCKEQIISDDNIDNDSIVQIDSQNNDMITIITPLGGFMYAIGDSINFLFDLKNNNPFDSIILFSGSEKIMSWTNPPYKLTWYAKDLCTGYHNFKFIVYFKNEKIAQKSVSLRFKSDIVPEEYTYTVIKEFPHSIKSYTQGFCFEDGYIYEGTGQYGESSILKYKLETNELVQSYNNEGSIFGEGIEIVDDRIIQLTWQSGVGFVYEKQSFKKISKFNIQTEGWGLVYDGKQLIMSDGTNNLHYLETSVFSTTKTIEVFDNDGPVSKLNELELIEGNIYANIYTKDIIVIIDPATGKVIGRIDLTGILNPKDKHNRIDVLNGIAWDEKGKRLLVTGKYWPKIYQIALIKK